MKKFIFIGILFFSGICLFGQTQPDSIKILGRKGTVFEQNGRALKIKQLLVITKSNPAAYKEIKIAKSTAGVAYVLLGASGFLSITGIINVNTHYSLYDKKYSWRALGLAAGFWVISLPIISSSGKHTNKGVIIYNKGLRSSSLTYGDIRIGYTNNGIGMKIRF
jgi:hypothetical protein